MAAGDGRRSYDILNGLLAELRAAKMTYAVVAGDSLWTISGKSEVYGNPYQWPLIYKANTDKIRDADLIYPGQELGVDKAPTQMAIDAATQHAKTRGAWSVGAVEESDKAYLNSGN
jgi:nucleoid-associated protein YgaU